MYLYFYIQLRLEDLKNGAPLPARGSSAKTKFLYVKQPGYFEFLKYE